MSGQLLSLRTEELSAWLSKLVAGERLTLSGVVYAAEEEAVKWLWERQEAGMSLPFGRQGSVLCAGVPVPNAEGEGTRIWEIGAWEGSDRYLPGLLRSGLSALVGRGSPEPDTLRALTRRRGVCFAPLGGSGRQNVGSICAVSSVMGEGLKEGALLRLGILDLPLVVTVDAAGGSLYERGPDRYRRKPKSLRW